MAPVTAKPVPAQHELNVMRRAAAAGIALPVVFLSTVALLLWAEWDFMTGIGYGPLEPGEVSFPSSLARGPYGWVQSANFAVAGVLTLVFLAGIRHEFCGRWSARIATVALAAFGLAGVLLNPFPTALPTEDQAELSNVLHGVGFLVTMLGMVVGFTATGLALRHNPRWTGWWAYAVTTPVALVVLAFTGLGLPGDIPWYLSLVVMMGWFGVLGFRLRQIASQSSVEER